MTADATRLRTLLHGDTPVTWVLTGDSITHGLVHTHGARNYVDHLHELIRGDMSRIQDVIINTAISGWRIVQLLDDFERRVATWRPHVVTLMIGTNDCSTTGALGTIEPAEFAASVTDFVARVRALGAIPVLQTQPAIDVRNAPERSRITEFAQAIRDVATAEDVILIDQFARFAEMGAGHVNDIPWGLLGDPFHPNAAGHALLALEVAGALKLAPLPERDRVLPALRALVHAAR
ncbi:SGNH/GDSL hydrolase family protein [Microbacterium sp. ARD32]|uniref:SGNH/GDSL hydrolase family protein n=1 Tax=Microbacterium sp. ARD32 TaxID=2962577 RepID=UPI002881608B|nr:SGNH/GDSL hydrolase family protein [Microbacterium sp. ARD32]MDT0157669.1 SGNH/GDSL hydrolase family protein [Microbacterium sp. ARD32]